MKKINIFSSIFLILFGGIFCYSSWGTGLGSVRAPGPGMIPFGTGGILILFSFGIILENILRRNPRGEPPLFRGKRWSVPVWVMACLFAYVLVLETLGFVLATFLIMAVLFRISEKQNWKTVFFASILTTGFSYFLFDYLLACSFPRGFLGF